MTEQHTLDAKDPMLDDMIDQIEAALPAAHKNAYQAIVVSGMHVLFSKQTHQLLVDAIKQHQSNLTKAVVRGTVKLMSILYRESRGKLSIPMAVPAAITLMCHILDYIKRANGFSVDKETLASMIKTLAQDVFKLFGINEQMLAKGIDYARSHKDEFEKTGTFAEPAAAAAPATPPAEPPGMAGTSPTGMIGA